VILKEEYGRSSSLLQASMSTSDDVQKDKEADEVKFQSDLHNVREELVKMTSDNSDKEYQVNSLKVNLESATK